MEDAISSVIEGRGIAVSQNQEDGAPFPFVAFAREGQTVRLPMPWNPDGLRDDPVGLFYTTLVTVQFYHECDDFLDWCEQLEADPASGRLLDEFRAIDGAIHELTAMVGQGDWADLMLRLAMGQAIAKARPG
jgi:hypothetical protein